MVLVGPMLERVPLSDVPFDRRLSARRGSVYTFGHDV